MPVPKPAKSATKSKPVARPATARAPKAKAVAAEPKPKSKSRPAVVAAPEAGPAPAPAVVAAPAPAAVAAPAPAGTSKASAVRAKASKAAEQRAKTARRASVMLKFVSDPTRLQVILFLAEAEHHVGALCEQLGQTQPAVSHHLALLRHGGVIFPRRLGKNNFYSLSDSGSELAKVVKLLLQSA